MISAFIIFSGVAALNCTGTSLAALVSFSSICWVLRAVPIKKSFLYASLNVGVVVDVVAFLLLLQEMNVTEIATVVKLNKKFLFMSIVFIYLIVLVSGGPRELGFTPPKSKTIFCNTTPGLTIQYFTVCFP